MDTYPMFRLIKRHGLLAVLTGSLDTKISEKAQEMWEAIPVTWTHLTIPVGPVVVYPVEIPVSKTWVTRIYGKMFEGYVLRIMIEVSDKSFRVVEKLVSERMPGGLENRDVASVISMLEDEYLGIL